MAPRSRLCGAGGTAANASIRDLPENVLTRCLGFLRLEERQQAALAGKRFAVAACSPDLLQDVEMPSHMYGVRKLQSLAVWLMRHGRHVRKLAFWSCGQDGEDEGAVAALTATCITAAGAAGQLIGLSISGNELQTEWLVAAPSLQRLCLNADLAHISRSISRLTALQSLHLAGDTEFEAVDRLPANITWLYLENDGAEEMAEQIGALPQLQRLQLESCRYSASSLSCLSGLSGSLTRLDLHDIRSLTDEAGLAALTRLQHLRCGLHAEEAGQAMAAALPHLTGLTCLMLWGNCHLNSLPSALGGLSRLQLCELKHTRNAVAGGQPTPLPVGPWLHSLRWLSINDSTLLRSLPALQAAAALERISIELSSPPIPILWRSTAADAPAVKWRSPAADAFFDWLARHPPLRCLTLSCDPNDSASLDLFEQTVCLCRRRPDLLIEFPDEGREGEELGAFLFRTDPF